MALSLLFLISCGQRTAYRQAAFDGQRVAVDIRSLKDKVPEFYSVAIDGKRIDFFVVLSAGEVTSYLDACKECYGKKSGYRYEKGALVCRACNVRFPCGRLDTGIGGCYPIKLPGKRDGDRYVIGREALEAGKMYF